MGEKEYYIQNGYIGNAILWWRVGRSGYTTDIYQAGKFSADEAKKIIQRPEDKAWLCSHVDNTDVARKTIIDGQYLNPKYRIIGKKK